MIWLLVAVCGGLGAITRYLLDRAVMARLSTDFPVGTLIINLSGSLALGFLVGMESHGLLGAAVATVIGTGYIGGYTTFSTLTFETLSLSRRGDPGASAVNMVGTVTVSALLAALGVQLGTRI